MVIKSNDILLPIKVDDNVLVAIPLADWGGGDAANLLVVSIEVKNGKFSYCHKMQYTSI